MRPLRSDTQVWFGRGPRNVIVHGWKTVAPVWLYDRHLKRCQSGHHWVNASRYGWTGNDDIEFLAGDCFLNRIYGASWQLDRPIGASGLLRRNLLIYGAGGIVAPFIGIKLIDLIIHNLLGA